MSNKINRTMRTQIAMPVERGGLINHDFSAMFGGREPPGGNDMLEPRVAHLEADMKEVKADIKLLVKDVAELKGRVAMLPGYGGIALVVGVIVGLSTLAQALMKFTPNVSP